MTDEVPKFIQSVTQANRRLYTAYSQALWQAAVTGSDAANERQKAAQAEHMRYWSDRDLFEKAKRLDERGHEDPVVARTLRVIYLSAAKAQQDEATIEQITELEAAIRRAYYNYRAEVDGQRLSDNELEEILTESRDSDEVERAWKASKQVGAQVADTVRELAHIRNRAARAAGYRDHFQKSLQLNEIDEGELFALLEELEEATGPLFAELKADIDSDRAQRFGISTDELRPWHYGDRFFQKAPEPASGHLEAAFKGQDPVPIARATYAGWGLEIDGILERSDLYAREGKNQHAFCLDLDREGDVRTLNNLEPNYRWTSTLLHELGHAVYDQYIEHSLPWLLRSPPHTLTTEAMALLAQSVVTEPEWMAEVMGKDSQEAASLAASARARDRASNLIFTRWVLVMTNFERSLYADPDRDLDSLWWELKERYQELTRPPGRHAPDWAAKYHVALAPVYYQNYQLGLLLKSQLRRHLLDNVGTFVGSPEVGDWLRTRLFAPGNRQPWAEHIQAATGESLQPSYFVDRLRAG